MERIVQLIVIFVVIIVAIFGFQIVRKIGIIDDIKEKVGELQTVTNFYQEISMGLSDIDNVDDTNKIIYRTCDNVIIWEQNGIKIVSYGGNEYIFNEEDKYYYDSDVADFKVFDLTSNIFPGGFSIDSSSWDLASNLDIRTEYFKNENCYVLTYEKEETKYINYIRQSDGVCIVTCEEKDGKTLYNYYKTSINTEKVNDFTYESIFSGYDKLIVTGFERPYVERSNGIKEYIDF